MKYTKQANAYYICFKMGEELVSTLASLCKSAGIATASFQMIGGAKEVELGFYSLTKKAYDWKTFTADEASVQYELASGQGSVTMLNGEPIVHAHAVLGDSEFKTFGGHVRKLIVGATCELVLYPQTNIVERRKDDVTGLNLWDCPLGSN